MTPPTDDEGAPASSGASAASGNAETPEARTGPGRPGARTQLSRASSWLIAAILAAAVGVPVTSVLTSISSKQDHAPDNPRVLSAKTPLDVLSQRAQRRLTGDAVPVPGTVSSTLGFGDPLPEGRRVYQYVGFTPVSTTAVFNSMVDVPNGVSDERKFLRVKATPRLTKVSPGAVPSVAAYEARPNSSIFLQLVIDNNAVPQRRCARLEGPSVAINTHLRMTVWDSNDLHVHVIRAWLSADNAKPAWITDAVAVKTAAATRLRLDASASWQYSQLPEEFQDQRSLGTTSVLEPAGMVAGATGLVGSCWQNRFAYYFVFRQAND